MNPKISVIIPVYNAEKYIEECLSSVCCQTFPEIEILCIDDCSTDSSVRKIEMMAVCDSRLILVQNEQNMGAGKTRNRGIMLARGKYFFFLDADDFLETDALEKLYYCAETHELQLCFCAHFRYYEADACSSKDVHTTDVFLKKYQNRVFSWNDVKRFLYQNIFCVPWNRLYLTDFVRNSPVRFPDLKNSEDFFFGNAIVTIAERMGNVNSDTPLVYYRLGREGQVSSTIEQNPYCMLESVKLLYDFLKENHKMEGMEKSYHSIVLDVLSFPIRVVSHSENLIYHTVKEGFPEIGMGMLQCKDFANAADYRQYRELLKGRIVDFNPYMVSVKEDKEKIEQIKQFLHRHKEEKIALWGMAQKGQILLNGLRGMDDGFDYYIDANPDKFGKEWKEGKIYKYQDIPEQLDYVMLTNANYFTEIYQQCKSKTPFCKVIDLYTFFRCDMTIEECMA